MNNQNLDKVEISDPIVFFLQNWKLITVFGVLGLFVSGIYGLLKPVQYEASFQIKIAQYISNLNIQPLTNIVNIEPLTELENQLKIPTVYSGEVLQKCGMSEGSVDGPFMNGRYNVSVINGVNAIEIKLRSNKPESARSCANSLQNNIIAMQQAMTDDLLKIKQKQLEQSQKSFEEIEGHFNHIKQGEMTGFAFLTSLDEMNSLRDRMDRLNDEIFFAKSHPAKLIAPIYVSSQPVSRKTPIIILGGIFAGMLLGIFFASLRIAVRKPFRIESERQ